MKGTPAPTLVDERVCDLERQLRRLKASADSYAAAGDDAFALEQYLNAGQLYGNGEHYRRRAMEVAARLEAISAGISGDRSAAPRLFGKRLRQRQSRVDRNERAQRIRRVP
jgi:hypothetical protein